MCGVTRTEVLPCNTHVCSKRLLPANLVFITCMGDKVGSSILDNMKSDEKNIGWA